MAGHKAVALFDFLHFLLFFQVSEHFAVDFADASVDVADFLSFRLHLVHLLLGRFVFVSGTELVNEEANVKFVRDLTTIKKNVTNNDTTLTEFFLAVRNRFLILTQIIAY